MIRNVVCYAFFGSEIRPVESQKAEKLALHIRGVRFDIFTRTAREIFDVEAQNRRLKDMRKRPRAYHTFDPFGKGRHIYSFQNYCTEDKNISLGGENI